MIFYLERASRRCSSKSVKTLLDKGVERNFMGVRFGSCITALC